MVIENRTEYPKAQLINQNYDLQVTQQEYAKTQAQKQALKQEVNKYIDGKLKEGYTKDASGNLTKTSGNTTTTIKIDEQGNISITERTSTPARTETKTTGAYEKIENDIQKLERQLERIESGKSTAGTNAVASIKKRLNQLYDARDNLANTGTAFYNVEVPEQVQEVKEKQETVFIGGFGYSVAPELQKTFIEQKQNQLKTLNYETTKANTQELYAPRQVNASETITIKNDFSKNITLNEPKKYSGVVSATKVGDFTPRTIDNKNVLGVDVQGYQQKYTSNYLVEPSAKNLVVLGGATIVGGLAQGGVNVLESGKQIFLEPAPTTTKYKVVNKALQVGETLNPINILKVGEEVTEKASTFAFKPNVLSAVDLTSTSARVGGEIATQVVLLKGVDGASKIVTANQFSKSDLITSTYENANPLMPQNQRINYYITNKFIEPFLKDTSAKTRLQTLQDFTGEKYTAQTTLYGDVYIERLKEKGFLAKENYYLEEKPTKENLVLPTGQKKIFEDSLQGGETLNPNILLTKKSIEGTNPQFKIVELDKPLNNFVEVKTKQTTLIKPTEFKELKQRNTLQELYGTRETQIKTPTNEVNVNKGVAILEEKTTPIQSVTLRKNAIENVLETKTAYEEISAKSDIVIERDVTQSGIRSTFPIKLQTTQTKSAGILEQPTRINTQKTNLNLQYQNLPSYETAQEPKSKTQLKFIQGTRTTQETTPESVQDNIKISKLSTMQEPTRATPSKNVNYEPTTKKITGKIALPTPTETRTQQTFIAKAKTKGKFITLGKYKTMGEAFNRGKQFVETTASATFKVESALGETKRPSLLPKGFAFSKSNYGSIIQKRGERIRTQGEKLEISSKGRQTIKARKSRGLFK